MSKGFKLFPNHPLVPITQHAVLLMAVLRELTELCSLTQDSVIKSNASGQGKWGVIQPWSLHGDRVPFTKPATAQRVTTFAPSSLLPLVLCWKAVRIRSSAAPLFLVWFLNLLLQRNQELIFLKYYKKWSHFYNNLFICIPFTSYQVSTSATFPYMGHAKQNWPAWFGFFSDGVWTFHYSRFLNKCNVGYLLLQRKVEIVI